jgi:hypothetical protein
MFVPSVLGQTVRFVVVDVMFVEIGPVVVLKTIV